MTTDDMTEAELLAALEKIPEPVKIITTERGMAHIYEDGTRAVTGPDKTGTTEEP